MFFFYLLRSLMCEWEYDWVERCIASTKLGRTVIYFSPTQSMSFFKWFWLAFDKIVVQDTWWQFCTVSIFRVCGNIAGHEWELFVTKWFLLIPNWKRQSFIISSCVCEILMRVRAQDIILYNPQPINRFMYVTILPYKLQMSKCINQGGEKEIFDRKREKSLAALCGVLFCWRVRKIIFAKSKRFSVRVLDHEFQCFYIFLLKQPRQKINISVCKSCPFAPCWNSSLPEV